MSNRADQSAAARRAMVSNQLRPQGVTDAGVLDAMSAVRREDYLPAKFAQFAYVDRSLLMDDGSPILPPAEIGQLLNQLSPRAGMSALVIGGGGAYSAALLRHMGLRVDIAASAEDADKGPYDLILIEGAAQQFPRGLAGKLIPGGRIGGAVIEDGVTRLATGLGDGKTFSFTTFAEGQVPLLASFNRPPAFKFQGLETQ
ncbi:MAG: protein-L-isoaspartate O-methyltransferase [Sphingomicrobium sp.]